MCHKMDYECVVCLSSSDRFVRGGTPCCNQSICSDCYSEIIYRTSGADMPNEKGEFKCPCCRKIVSVLLSRHFDTMGLHRRTF